MTKIISFFNNKGGVSKTTTCFNLGWMLASMGKSVVMVDADPQCNLTGMVIDAAGPNALDDFYKNFPGRNIKDALEPAFASRPKPIEPVDCLPVTGCERLWLVPGHVGLAEDEVSLGIAQQLSESIQALKNLPGSFRHLFEITASQYNADYVLLDLSPGLGSINQNLVTISHFVAVPASPDIFSLMALESISRIIPRWIGWARSAASLDALRDADYAFPQPTLKFLGLIVQRYRLRSGKPTEAFQQYFDQLDKATTEMLVPALKKIDLLLPDERYDNAQMEGAYRLASISDFNTLIAYSQDVRKPVFALSQADTGRSGFVWDTQKANIDEFERTFRRLAERVESLTR